MYVVYSGVIQRITALLGNKLLVFLSYLMIMNYTCIKYGTGWKRLKEAILSSVIPGWYTEG